MSFFSEAAVRAGLPELGLAGGYNVINYNGNCVYVEGVKQLILVEPAQISLELFGARLCVKGQDLRISELSDAVIIKGQVEVMEFSQTSKKDKKNAK